MVGRRQVLAGMGGLLATIVGELRLLGGGKNATARGPIGTNGDARLVAGFLLLDDGELYAGPIVAPPSDLVPRLENLSDGSVESGFRIDHLPQDTGASCGCFGDGSRSPVGSLTRIPVLVALTSRGATILPGRESQGFGGRALAAISRG